MLPPIAPAICASSVRSRPLSRSSANRHPAISRSIQAFASRAIGTSPSHRDADGRGASLFDTIDCYLRREQTMWVIASLTGGIPRRERHHAAVGRDRRQDAAGAEAVAASPDARQDGHACATVADEDVLHIVGETLNFEEITRTSSVMV